MQTTSTTAQAVPTPLLFARHLVGMGILALANPLIYFGDAPAVWWLQTWLSPIVIALVVYGLYALFLTARAKRAWPKSFFMLAWVLLVLSVAGSWINTPRTSTSPKQSATQPIPAPVVPSASKDDENGPWNKYR